MKKLDKQNLSATAIESDRLILLHRWQDRSQIFSILNFADEAVSFTNNIPQGKWQKLLDSSEAKWMGDGTSLPQAIELNSELIIQPQSIAIYQQ